MNGLLGAAREFQEFCDARGWQSCLIGGIAVQRWGEPRVTRDVDVTLLTGFGHEDSFIEALLARYAARLSDAAAFARRNRTLLLQTPAGVGIDVMLAALPFEELAIAHATDFEFAPGQFLRTCSAEDLVVMKLFAFRALDLRDAEGIVLRNPKLDWNYIEEQLHPLAELKDEPGILETLARLRSQRLR
jgi:hypothetical protein